MRDYVDALDEQVTPYPQTVKVKMEDAPMLLKFPRSEFLEWIRLPRYKWRKTWQTMEELFSFLWKGNCTETPLAGLLWERPFEKKKGST